VAGEGFGTTEHVRISYATSMQNIDKALERMRKYFGGL
jgi:aspartate aminotransferase